MFITYSTANLLGSGQYGTVHKGEWLATEGGEKIEVAVKTLKEGADKGDKVKFLQEAAIMGQFSHPNIVKLYGVITERKPVSISYYIFYHSPFYCFNFIR